MAPRPIVGSARQLYEISVGTGYPNYKLKMAQV
jgi:hypothetical protein